MPLSDPNHPTFPGPASSFHMDEASTTPERPEQRGHFPSRLAPTALNESPTIGALIRALKRRWIIALFLGAVGAVLVGALIFTLMPAPYIAQANIRVLGRPPAYVTGGDAHLDLNDILRNQAAIMQNEMFWAAWKSDKVKALDLYKQHVDDVGNWKKKAVIVKHRVGDMNLPILVESDNANDAAKLATWIAEEYVQAMVERREKRLKTLKAAQTDLLEMLREKQKDVEVGGGDGNIDERLRNARALYQESRKQILDLQTKIRGAKAHRQILREGGSVVPDKATLDTALRTDTRMRELEIQLKAIQAAYANLVRLLPQGASDPRARSKKLDVDAMEERLKRRRKVVWSEVEAHTRREKLVELDLEILRLDQELNERKRQEEAAHREVQSLEKAGGLGKKPVAKQAVLEEIRALKESLRVTGMEIHQIESERKDALGMAGGKDIRKALASNRTPSLRWAVMSQAGIPTMRDRKKQLMMTFAGGFGIFGALVLLVAYLEFRSRKICRTEELSEGLGLPAIGTIPRLPSRAQHVTVDASASGDLYWQGRLTEAIDAIRTLLLRVTGEGPKVVMVTSAVEGEGKTSLASQLAASLARSWRKTLLIDGDLRKPAAHKLFNLPVEPGLSEVLRSEMELQDVIRPTSLGRLWLMPAGQWDSHAVQAMAQEGMNGLFNQLRDEYEVIIVDSSPVLPVADTLLLGQQADSVILSVLHGSSRLPQVYAAHQRLASLEIPVLGAVLIGGSDGVGGLDIQYPRQSGS